jgi:hypothetical protein
LIFLPAAAFFESPFDLVFVCDAVWFFCFSLASAMRLAARVPAQKQKKPIASQTKQRGHSND